MSRRTRNIALASFLIFIVSGIAAVLAAIGSSGERIDHYWASISMSDTSDNRQVVEVIDYDFGSEDQHGILRDIQNLASGSEIGVTSETAPDQFLMLAGANDQTSRLQVGDPDKTIDGRHRYRLSFQTIPSTSKDNFTWLAIGKTWEVDISKATLHLTADRELSEVTCGATKGGGSIEQCEVKAEAPGHVVITVGEIPAGSGVTIQGTWGETLSAIPTVSEPAPIEAQKKGTNPLRVGGIALLAGLFGAALSEATVWIRGRELTYVGPVDNGSILRRSQPTDVGKHIKKRSRHSLAKQASVRYTPPVGITAAEAGVLYEEQLLPRHKVAWLLSSAARREIVLETKTDTPTIKRGPTEPQPDTAEILDVMFNDRSEISLESYDKSFSTGWTKIGTRLKRILNQPELWDPKGETQADNVEVFGTLGAVVAAVALGVTAALAGVYGSTHWVVGVGISAVVTGTSIMLSLRAWELAVRSPKGSQLWTEIESFRKSFADVDTHHATKLFTEDKVDEYTSWAVALNQTKTWPKELLELTDSAQNPSTLADDTLFATLLLSGSGDYGDYWVSTTDTATTQPTESSTSSSSFAGGFSGGGFDGGGGGGGSW